MSGATASSSPSPTEGQSKPAKQRICYIDIAKGFAMLCIIAGHFGIVSAERFVFTFHVPLFFLLSGYFLSTKVSFLPFMKQKARQLLVPYYVTGVVLLVVATVVNHFVWPEIDALNNAKSMLGALLYGSGAPHSEPFAIRQIGLLWFLWALFFSTGFYPPRTQNQVSVAHRMPHSSRRMGELKSDLASFFHPAGRDGLIFHVPWIPRAKAWNP